MITRVGSVGGDGSLLWRCQQCSVFGHGRLACKTSNDTSTPSTVVSHTIHIVTCLSNKKRQESRVEDRDVIVLCYH